MRRSDHRIAILGGVTFFIVVALGCGAKRPTPPPGLDEAQRAGWQAYVDLNCGACHGANREGRRSGPALVGLAKHWDAAGLVHYLSDPDAVVRANPRLRMTAEKYAIGMPTASGKSPGFATKARGEKLQVLAEYLLVDVAPGQD